MIIEFRTNSQTDIWMRFYPPVPDQETFVAERNQTYGWIKYRLVRGKKS